MEVRNRGQLPHLHELFRKAKRAARQSERVLLRFARRLYGEVSRWFPYVILNCVWGSPNQILTNFQL